VAFVAEHELHYRCEERFGVINQQLHLLFFLCEQQRFLLLFLEEVEFSQDLLKVSAQIGHLGNFILVGHHFVFLSLSEFF
jgi:hypothetical protein